MTDKEQGRLWASLEEAAASFGRCPPSGPGVYDAAAIRVTATVSLRAAEEQVREYFKAFRGCRLSAVLVCRANMTHDGSDADSRVIAYESVIVLNARIPRRSGLDCGKHLSPGLCSGRAWTQIFWVNSSWAAGLAIAYGGTLGLWHGVHQQEHATARAFPAACDSGTAHSDP